MLLSKTVMVGWISFTKKWYENKGYIYTKMGDKFEVKVEDLSDGSHVLVEVKCDCDNCINPYLEPMPYRDYLKSMHEDGKYYCNKCAMELYGVENNRLSKLKNSVSFKQWCLENKRQDVLDRWDYELNNKKPSEINYSTHEKYWFKCPKRIHPSELKDIHSFTNRHEGSIQCMDCNSFVQWGIDNLGEDFLKKYWDYEKNNELGINPWKIDKSSNKKIWIKCQEKDYHDSYLARCSSFARGGRCPYCYGLKIHPLDSLGSIYPNVINVWGEENKKSPYEYSPKNGEKVWWKCHNGIHEDYLRSIANSNKYNFKCPECSRERTESILQEKVRLYLENLNYTILHENKCTIVPKNPKTKNNLPFDNEIKELKLVIEVNGEQHYTIASFTKLQAQHNNTTPEYELHYQKLKDRYKRMYAKSQGYNYIVIPYWTDNKEETWKQLINNKININILGGW